METTRLLLDIPSEATLSCGSMGKAPHPSTVNRISQSIRSFRTSQGWTRRKMAEWLSQGAPWSVSWRTIENWEQGRSMPTGDNMVLLLDAGVDLGQ